MGKAFRENPMTHMRPKDIPVVQEIDIYRHLKETDLNKEIMRFYHLVR